MIRVARRGGRTELVDGATGGEAFVDADWVAAAGGGEVPCLVARDGEVRAAWSDRVLAASPDGAERTVAAALLAVAEDAAGIVAARAPAGRVEVIGAGLVAGRVRALLGARTEGDERPAAVVDAVGSAGTFAAAAERVGDGGLVVLGGAPGLAVEHVDLYRDVHARGLVVVGVPRPLEGETPEPGGGPAGAPPATAVGPGDALDGPAAWFRIGPAAP